MKTKHINEENHKICKTAYELSFGLQVYENSIFYGSGAHFLDKLIEIIKENEN